MTKLSQIHRTKGQAKVPPLTHSPNSVIFFIPYTGSCTCTKHVFQFGIKHRWSMEHQKQQQQKSYLECIQKTLKTYIKLVYNRYNKKTTTIKKIWNVDCIQILNNYRYYSCNYEESLNILSLNWHWFQLVASHNSAKTVTVSAL